MKIRVLTVFVAIAFAAISCAPPPPPASDAPDDNDVVLLPADDFPSDLAADLAKIVASDTGLHVRSMLPLGTRDWKPYAGSQQYDPDVVKQLAQPAIAQLKKSYGGTLYVIVTSRDINSSDHNLRFVFAQHYQDQKVSVVSAARMALGERGAVARPDVVKARLRKMLLRTIGIQYYELERSTDLREVMYSPLMSLDDLDAMGLVLKAKGRAPAGR